MENLSHRNSSSSNRLGQLRCEIADELYERARTLRAVPAGVGWLPWATKTWGEKRRGFSRARRLLFLSSDQHHEEAEAAAIGDAGDGVSSRSPPGGTRAEHGEGTKLLDEAVRYYRLAANSTDSTGARRGLFSLGWLHQVCECLVGFWSS